MINKNIFITVLFTFFLNSESQEIKIFGGENHDVFLGCLNCNKYSGESIWNKYGDFGSKYKDVCIWNKYGDYGGKYSDLSPFNKYANNPPVLVDPDGKFYGYLTANKYKSGRTSIKTALMIVDFWEIIIEDVSEYYDNYIK